MQFVMLSVLSEVCSSWELLAGVYLYSLEMEKEMATHSNILAWKILWIEEPGGLQSTGS